MVTTNQIHKYLLTPSFWGAWGVLLLLSGCVKDTIYNTDYPDKARVNITTDWSDRGNEPDKPATYIISTGNIQEEANADTYTLNTLFDAGNYIFYLYNDVVRIPVREGIAKVNTVTNPQLQEGIFIEPFPGWLFTGILTQQLEKDNEYHFTTNMHQQVRQLTLILDPEGGSVDRITAITGYLTGVARELNISNNTHSAPSKIAFGFTKITEGNDAGKWLALVQLLGITGEEQKLTGTITFSNGSPEDIIQESNLSSVLSDFNNNKKSPLTLGAQIVEVPTGAGFTATITDWEKVDSGTGIAK